LITITLLHPGSMGAAIGAEAVRAGTRVLWVPDGRSAITQERAEQAGLEASSSLASALRSCDVVLSVCPTQAAEDVAQQVAERGFSGVYVEANAISPQRVTRIAAVAPEVCRVVDGSIFGPDANRTRVACLYLAGDTSAADILRSAFEKSRVEVRILEGPIGRASALKMAFINFQRSARVLTALSHALAERHQVVDELLKEAEGMSSKILADSAYLSTLAARAWRWAPEMREVTDALHGVGLPGEMAETTAATLLRWEADKDTDLPLAEVLDHLRRDHGAASREP
jgi:3-hydroxyisobutyrate dehydrogenase-like beta-hydroxyacid dehydrogenase